jgi:neurotransmitter:Na+ symporter, NSS family
MKRQRDNWKTKTGLVLAMAGNAVGLGNFLRFPGKAAANGGGAFMIPYFICLLLMAIPLMWLEWGQGRYGGARGHGSTPGIFESMWKHRAAKYIGVLGLFIPSVILVYYTYIGSWTLGFGISSLMGWLPSIDSSLLSAGMSGPEVSELILKPFDDFRSGYTGIPSGQFLQVGIFTYAIFLGVFSLSLWILARGVSRGIEILAKVGMPLLFCIAGLLVIRILSLGHPVSAAHGSLDGLAFLWEPQWFIERDGVRIFVLLDPQVWLEAAGQVLFTLSLGMGAIQCYASYVSRDDDIILSGAAATSANEFAEVVIGGSIVIPAAVAFFGVAATQMIASQGSFFLGFTSVPAVFALMPAGNFLGFLWFFLLFIAALTSIVGMAQPMIAFLEDELKMTRVRAAAVLGTFWFIGSHLCIYLRGGWQVMDFWAGTFGPPLLALVEVLIIMWIFGGERMWQEMHRGSRLTAPRFFYFTARYITPLLLAVILGAWGYQYVIAPLLSSTLSESVVEGVGRGWSVWITRCFMILIFFVMCLAVHFAWKRKEASA